MNDRQEERQKAIAFMELKHEGQYRRDGVTPYKVHPLRVAEKAEKRFGGSNFAVYRIGLFHDLLEDTETTLSELRAMGLTDHEIEALKLLTKDKYDDYGDYIEAISRNAYARSVKIADILDNLGDNPTDKAAIKYVKALLILLEA